jgi:hypothetical protein
VCTFVDEKYKNSETALIFVHSPFPSLPSSTKKTRFGNSFFEKKKKKSRRFPTENILVLADREKWILSHLASIGKASIPSIQGLSRSLPIVWFCLRKQLMNMKNIIIALFGVAWLGFVRLFCGILYLQVYFFD